MPYVLVICSNIGIMIPIVQLVTKIQSSKRIARLLGRKYTIVTSKERFLLQKRFKLK